MDLVEFLLARIDEDEKRAGEVLGGGYALLAAEPTDWRWQCGVDGPSYSQAPTPRRVLAECEAKRRIVTKWQAVDAEWLAKRQLHQFDMDAVEDAMWAVMKALALPYADHPDYQPAWSPLSARAR